MRAILFRVLLVVGVLACYSHAGASEQMTLKFQSVGSTTQIQAVLLKPDGDGPFPAIVIMHDCSGIGARSSGVPMRWARELVPQGYVVVIPDSFTPRDFPDGICTEPPSKAKAVGGLVRAGDAYGALEALRKLPFVDGRKIGIMGGSHGGLTTLAAMSTAKDDAGPLTAAKKDGFAAGIALYPNCGARFGDWSTVRLNGDSGPVVSYAGVYKPIAPVLILSGEKDDWTPSEDCRKMVETSRDAGYPMSIVIYPGAYHSFDSGRPFQYNPRRTNLNSPSGKGASTGGDPVAWEAARQQVSEFFARYLKR